MPTSSTLRVFHLPFSFMLPQQVASERGYFAAEGLEVELLERDRERVDWKYVPAGETLTGDADVDLYPVCKWESLKRTWALDDGRIVAHGAFADLPYTLHTRPETDIEDPSDLATVPVAVNRRTGQEYTAMRALEEHLDPDEIELEHHGMPTDRLRALRDGEVEAATLLDPHSTLADHLGFERVLEFENHVGIVGTADLDDEALEEFVRAYRRAVEAINENPAAFRAAYLEMLESDREVAPDLFENVDVDRLRESVTVPRYEVPELADPDELDDHLEWMKERDLIDEGADVDAIVAPSASGTMTANTTIDIGTQQAALDELHDDPGDLPVMRARFEHNGSPRYLLYTIKRFGFDRDHGFHLDVRLVSDELEEGRETVEAKLHEGEADLIDIDYVSTARERADGAPIVAFHPYGRTVGGLVVPEESPIEGLADLRDCRVGVVRRLDKNWILTRAACREYHGFDPEDEATSVESGSKVELTRLLRDGEVDAALQFWQIVPEIVETGPYREVLPMSELVQRLSGADDTLPISTFLTGERYLSETPEAVRGFKRAYADAVERLRTDDDLWEELAERMMYEDDPAVVRGIRDGWREMVVTDWDADTVASMERLFDHLLEVAGADALGVDHVPDDTFRLEVPRTQ